MSRLFPSGDLHYRVTVRDSANVYNISVTLPDGSIVTGLPTTQGSEYDLGQISAGPVTLTLNDTSFGGATWDDSVVAHCHVASTPFGFLYAWDDLGGGTGSDGDFDDIIIELFVPVAINTCSVRIGIYGPDAETLIAYVPRRRNVSWLDELNAPGTGKFDIWLDDPILTAYPNLLDQYNIVKVFLGDYAAKAWVIEETNPTTVGSGDGADRWVSVAGRGVLSVLEAAVVYPEYGLREFVSEDRYFNFASADGVWRNPAEWVTPVGVRWDADTTARASYPKNWPDPAAQYLWSSSPNANSAPGVNWLRSTFTVATTTAVVIYATADNYFTAYMDGQIVLASAGNTSSFRNRYEWRMTLAAGTHTLAAVVTNVGATANPAGFIATIYQTSASGAATSSNVFRTTPANTLVKAYGAAPGWTGAAVLQQLITEAQDRDVTALLPITFDFTNALDSDGNAWDDIQERVIKVATTDLADLATQIIELGLDLELDPDFVLHAWKTRGTDQTQDVIIRPNRDVLSAAGNVRAGKLRNQGILKFDGGWIELFSAGSKDLYGRREVGISLGTSASTDQTILAGSAIVRETARPEQTIPMSYACTSGPQPYSDYILGDSVTVPGVWSGMTSARLMSITGTEEETYVKWDLDFYPNVADDVIDSVVVATGGTYQDLSGLYQSEVLSDSPWGYWRLKETTGNLTDRSGHARTMIIETGAAGLYNQGGPIDKAYLWGNTTAQYSHTNNHFAQGIATVEAWVYITNLPTSGKATIIGMAQALNDATHDKNLGIRDDGKLFFYVFAGGTGHELTSPSALALNTWHHVVGSVGAQGQKLYVNGVLVASGVTITSYTGSQLVYMHHGGSGYSTAARFFIAEPAIYGQQLLNSRITSHFDAATP